MKKSIFYILFTLLSMQFTFAQLYINTNEKNEKAIIKENGVFWGVGIGIGVFYPDDVNDYIKSASSNMQIEESVTDMFMNYVGRLSVSYKVNKKLTFTFLNEYGLAFTFLIDTGNEEIKTFSFIRVSPGLLTKIHFPIKSGRHSLYIAPGINYHFMKFEEYKANGIGGKLQFGFSLNFRKSSLQPFFSIDYANATDNSHTVPFNLNYSGLQWGVDYNF